MAKMRNQLRRAEHYLFMKGVDKRLKTYYKNGGLPINMDYNPRQEFGRLVIKHNHNELMEKIKQ